MKSVRKEVGVSIRLSVIDSAWGLISDSVDTSVWQSVWRSVRNSIRYTVQDSTKKDLDR